MMYPFHHFLASTSLTSNFGFVNFQKKTVAETQTERNERHQRNPHRKHEKN